MFVHTTVSIFTLQHFNDPNLNCFTFWGSADHCGGGSVDLSAYTVLGSNPKNKKDENKQKRPVYAHIFKHIYRLRTPLQKKLLVPQPGLASDKRVQSVFQPPRCHHSWIRNRCPQLVARFSTLESFLFLGPQPWT